MKKKHCTQLTQIKPVQRYLPARQEIHPYLTQQLGVTLSLRNGIGVETPCESLDLVPEAPGEGMLNTVSSSLRICFHSPDICLSGVNPLNGRTEPFQYSAKVLNDRHWTFLTSTLELLRKPVCDSLTSSTSLSSIMLPGDDC